ncbi:MAG: GNAT family N-acetyltransferase, partial [Lachnospiraceae bacterium]|nr:GNAT family N-acetyltransferase [Lachnospiraceae bacterium]
MDNFVDERDYKLIEGDKYTFFVLRKIIGWDCSLLLSDHEKLIICHSANPYPVWIWTPDDASDEELERAYIIAKENNLIDGEHTFNTKDELAEYFIKRASEEGINMNIKTNMFAYDCPEPIKPEYLSDGKIHRCVPEDKEELVEILDLFHKETGVDQKNIEEYKKDADFFINCQEMYFWKDNEGNTVASCKNSIEGELASINIVFTRPEYRRKHYAENLVYEVSIKAKNAGYLPMLYTDADYVASNACYEKIGYVL